MRPNRRVGDRSACARRRLAEALEPATSDPDPFDPPEDWRVTTTEDDPSVFRPVRNRPQPPTAHPRSLDR